MVSRITSKKIVCAALIAVIALFAMVTAGLHNPSSALEQADAYTAESVDESELSVNTSDKCQHEMRKADCIKATTEGDGVKAHWVCNVCGKVFLDANGKKEVTDEHSLVIPQIGAFEAETEFTYTGKKNEPSVVVYDVEGREIDSTNYNVSYTDNINAGTGQAIVEFAGESYAGSKVISFTINKAAPVINASNLVKNYGVAPFNLNATCTSGGKLTYKCSNTRLVTVNTAGKITIKGAGKVTITITAKATQNYLSAAKTITLTVKAPAKITVERSKKLVKAKHTYKVPQPKRTDLVITKWKSSKPSVASVSKYGTVKGKKIGTTIVRGYNSKGKLLKVVTVKVRLGRDYAQFIARRGYCRNAPENTLPAFRNAVKAGYRGIEMDIWESRTTAKASKPCIIVMHDANIKHKTGKNKKTSTLNWSNRKNWKIKKNVSGLKTYGKQTIPTLNEALNCVYAEADKKGYKYFIVELDIKNSLSDRAVKSIVQMVGKHPVHILSNDLSNLAKFKKYRKYKTTEVWFCSSTTNNSKRIKNIKKAGRSGYDGISIPYWYMTSSTIKLIKSYGMKPGVYNIAKATDVQRLRNKGVVRFNMRGVAFCK